MDRETVYQSAVAVGTVLLFLAVAVVVSSVYSTDGGLSATGGIALVGAILVFILVMSVAGLWLERAEFDDEDSS